ncbi:MAG: hypothetical protein QOI63_137 [Thermoplasmata archaeon]|jgi:hypothetical protein|nr:hypothetical protein [Thermoplasmata archaeon]
MKLPPAEQEEFEALLWKGHTASLSAGEEVRLRHLVGMRNPAAQALPLPQLVNAGLVAHGADVLLRALVED